MWEQVCQANARSLPLSHQSYVNDDDLCFSRPPEESELLAHARANPDDKPEEVGREGGMMEEALQISTET